MLNGLCWRHTTGSRIWTAHLQPYSEINREGGGTMEESNRWKTASLPEPPAEINGWKKERLLGSSTWCTLFQGHSWAADLATGISGELRRNDCRSPVDLLWTSLHLIQWDCRWKLDQILMRIWCNLPQRFTTVRNLMHFIWKTSSKTALGRMKKYLSTCPRLWHLNDSPDCSRNTSDRLVMAGDLLHPIV